MTDIADSYQMPKDLAGLCWEMYDTIASIPKHMVPRPGGLWRDENDWLEVCLIMRSCYEQRLEQLGIKRPNQGETHGPQ